MRSVLAISTLILAACTTPQNATKDFYARDLEVTKICTAPLYALPVVDRFTVSAQTGRSPFANAAWCYANQIQAVVAVTKYPNAAMVRDFSNHVVRLTEARDRGIIDTKTAIDSYNQSAALFRQSIAVADSQSQQASSQDLARRIAIFTSAMAAVTAEQERQRRANRPVVCTLTGVYVQNTVVCH